MCIVLCRWCMKKHQGMVGCPFFFCCSSLLKMTWICFRSTILEIFQEKSWERGRKFRFWPRAQETHATPLLYNSEHHDCILASQKLWGLLLMFFEGGEEEEHERHIFIIFSSYLYVCTCPCSSFPLKSRLPPPLYPSLTQWSMDCEAALSSVICRNVGWICWALRLHQDFTMATCLDGKWRNNCDQWIMVLSYCRAHSFSCSHYVELWLNGQQVNLRLLLIVGYLLLMMCKKLWML